MDHVRRWLPELHLRVYVDDLKGTFFGDQGTLAGRPRGRPLLWPRPLSLCTCRSPEARPARPAGSRGSSPAPRASA